MGDIFFGGGGVGYSYSHLNPPLLTEGSLQDQMRSSNGTLGSGEVIMLSPIVAYSHADLFLSGNSHEGRAGGQAPPHKLTSACVYTQHLKKFANCRSAGLVVL